jgi:hypothetical protein
MSACILAHLQDSQEQDDKTKTPYTPAAHRGTTRIATAGMAQAGPQITSSWPTPAQDDNACLVGNLYAALALVGETTPPNKLADTSTTAKPRAEFYNFITIPPALRGNGPKSRATVEMFKEQGQIADKAMAAFNCDINSKLNKSTDTIMAWFMEKQKVTNTTINATIGKACVDIAMTMDDKLRVIWETFDEKLAKTASLFQHNMEELIADSAKRFDTSINTINKELATVKDVTNQVDKLAKTIARVDRDVTAYVASTQSLWSQD